MRNLILLVLLFLAGCSSQAQPLTVIPKPATVSTRPGTLTINRQTPLVVNGGHDQRAAELFNGYLEQTFGFKLPLSPTGGPGSILITTRQFIKAPDKDGYSLTITPSGVEIEGDTHAGTFYGLQTLLQLLPVSKKGAPLPNKFQLPLVSITDAPRFNYRGMHLDVGRHLFPVAFIKQYIDYIALHKMNYFHWHLTEDQGWRMEIKKYPELNTKGAWRNGTIVGRYPGKGNDNQRYGGFYTQEEIREIVQYAAERYITVVPEIEMPGHSSAAIAAYPWLSCFPEKETEIPHHPSIASQRASGKKVQETWGVFNDIFCAGKDSTFLFLQDVLDEVMALFPSKYVHIGGDEAPKAHWRKCPRCQARIKAEGLKDEHGLQSYFIQRIEKYLNAKGRTLIGWDEILEGGLAPNAVVMSWRGEAGGIAAAKQNHYVIMTPGSHVYFDHSQSNKEDSVTIGGFTNLEKVYSYEPVPKELNAAQAKFVLGAQANVWTEYMRYPSKVEYMIFPRISALSEVLWSPKAARNWSDFERRMQTQYLRYERWGNRYSTAFFDIRSKVLPAPGNNGLLVKMETKDRNGKIMYASTGRHYPKDYTAPVLVNESAEITGLYVQEGAVLDSSTLRLKFNKATGRKITLSVPPAPNYPGNGAFTLVDGIINERGMARTSDFIGYNGKKVEILIDLGVAQSVQEVRVHALSATSSWVHEPQEAQVFVSENGKTFTRLGTAREFKGITENKGSLDVWSEPVTARFVKIQVTPLQKIPAHMPGAGSAAWMFLDEVEVL